MKFPTLLLVCSIAAAPALAQSSQKLAQAMQSGMKIQSVVVVQPGFDSFVEAPPSIFDQKTTEYVFGRLISREALAVQVTITNKNHDYNLLISQVSLLVCHNPEDDKPQNTNAQTNTSQSNTSSGNASQAVGSQMEKPPDCKDATVDLASMDKGVLQGLADRGQSKDPRNLALRILEGVGSAAVPFPTFMRVGPSFLPAVAAFNGPGIDAYKTVFPDYTVNQVIRLGNLAFTTNKVVAKNSTDTVVGFIPLNVLWSRDDVHTFQHDPHGMYIKLARRAIVKVDAQFVTPASAASAKITSVVFNLTSTPARIELTGQSFQENSKVLLNGKALPSTFWTSTSIWGFLDPTLTIKSGDPEKLVVQFPDNTTSPECDVNVSSSSQTCPAQNATNP